MADVREVKVEFRKTVSDGSYGNETYSIAFTATLDELTDQAQEIAFTLADQAHAEVLAHLRASTSEAIRRALETPEEREARQQRERAEREAERERWRLQAEKEEAERVAQYGQLRGPDASDEEDEEDDDDRPAPF